MKIIKQMCPRCGMIASIKYLDSPKEAKKYAQDKIDETMADHLKRHDDFQLTKKL